MGVAEKDGEINKLARVMLFFPSLLSSVQTRTLHTCIQVVPMRDVYIRMLFFPLAIYSVTDNDRLKGQRPEEVIRQHPVVTKRHLVQFNTLKHEQIGQHFVLTRLLRESNSL